MPQWVVTILTSGACTLLTVIITFIFNGIINLPKQKKKKEAEEEQKRQDLLAKFDKVLAKSNDAIKDELNALQARDKIFEDDLKLLKRGLQASLKNDLKNRYEDWIGKGYAPIDAKDDLEGMYQAYHGLWQNGVMDAMRAEFLALPTERIIKKRNQNTDANKVVTPVENK